jgi:hypothetical protein
VEGDQGLTAGAAAQGAGGGPGVGVGGGEVGLTAGAAAQEAGVGERGRGIQVLTDHHNCPAHHMLNSKAPCLTSLLSPLPSHPPTLTPHLPPPCPPPPPHTHKVVYFGPRGLAAPYLGRGFVSSHSETEADFVMDIITGEGGQGGGGRGGGGAKGR